LCADGCGGADMPYGASFDLSGCAGVRWRRRVNGNNISEAFPRFTDLDCHAARVQHCPGLSLGLLSFTFLKLGTGRYKEISGLIWILSILFSCRYAFSGQ
jgi:xanthine/uracil/vitamin C permease (AzgA family)